MLDLFYFVSFLLSAFYLLCTYLSYPLVFMNSFMEPQPVKVTELELANQSLRETFKLKEKEVEYPMKGLHKHQADGLR